VIADAASKDSHFLGTDWAIILRCLRAGRFHRVSSGWTLLGRQGESNGPRIFKLSRNHWYERIAPFAALSRVAFALTSDFSLASRARLAVLLARLNFQALVRLVRMTMRESFRRRRA
jgi:hypothetical protein